MAVRIVYYKPLASSKVYDKDELWAYTEDNGKTFGIVHRVLGTESRIFASREELESILKNEDVAVPSNEES